MDNSSSENPVALAIAQAMIEGFNKHYRIFRETTRRAKESYEAAAWQEQGTQILAAQPTARRLEIEID